MEQAARLSLAVFTSCWKFRSGNVWPSLRAEPVSFPCGHTHQSVRRQADRVSGTMGNWPVWPPHSREDPSPTHLTPRGRAAQFGLQSQMEQVSGLGPDCGLQVCALCLYRKSQLQTSQPGVFLRQLAGKGIRFLVVSAETATTSPGSQGSGST